MLTSHQESSVESAYKLRRLRNAKRRPMWTPLDYAGLHATEATAQPMGLFGARVSLSYCLGLLTADDLAMLVLIKDIRMLFRRKKKGASRRESVSAKQMWLELAGALRLS